MKYIQFDVMRRDLFIGTFRMPYNALFDKPKPEDLLEYLYERRPTLRYCSKELSIFVDNY